MSRSRAVRYLEQYVAVPSINPMGRTDIAAGWVGETRYAELLQHHLGKLGIDAQLVGEGARRSVVGEVRAGAARDTLLVASHLDTVPVDSMTIDPFDPVVKDGRLQGRGSCDTKAGMAALMAALERVLERGTLERNLLVVGEADEEAESVGVRDVLAHLGSARVDFAIATEPTELRLVNAHKGTALVRVVGRGRACHSSDPSLGENAIVALSRAVLSLTRLGQRLVEGKAHERLGPATLSIGVIWGGQAPNIVPDSATLLMDRRTLPGETLDDIRDEVRAAFERDGVTNVEIAGVQAGKQPLHTDESHAATLACQRALRRAGLEAPAEPVPFGTDAGLFAREGIPSLVLGPGSIHRAHTDTEYVEIDQLERMVGVFEHLLEEA